jgi:hypothetical protein
MVEIFFGIITRQAIRRGTVGSVRELIEAIRRFIDGWSDRWQPFVWAQSSSNPTVNSVTPVADRGWLVIMAR